MPPPEHGAMAPGTTLAWAKAVDIGAPPLPLCLWMPLRVQRRPLYSITDKTAISTLFHPLLEIRDEWPLS